MNPNDILKIIRNSPILPIKAVFMKESKVTRSLCFQSRLSFFKYLDDTKQFSDSDSLAVCSVKPVKISDIEVFMSGRFLRSLFIIEHDFERIPQHIDAYFRVGSSVIHRNSPFFLFNPPETESRTDQGRPAAAFFIRSATPSENSENMKLATDAGYCVIKTFQLRTEKPVLLKNSILRELKKLEEIESALIFFEISPADKSFLEKESGMEILSKEDLIMTIFHDRADGSSGKLKVAGAVVKKEKSEFRRNINGLSRIKGGIGLKGPGETKEEERKRILKNKEKTIRKQLESEFTRLDLQKKYRSKSNIKTVAVTGYTNAGKSTLFNALINEKVTLESDKFFSSIDPKIRKISLFCKPVYFIDTVGFISGMTKDITDAFHATLAEVAQADLILHIVDATNSDWRKRMKFIDSILMEKGTEKEKIVTLFSKSDLIKIKHPVKNGFFYSSFYREDIYRIKRFIHDFLFA